VIYYYQKLKGFDIMYQSKDTLMTIIYMLFSVMLSFSTVFIAYEFIREIIEQNNISVLYLVATILALISSRDCIRNMFSRNFKIRFNEESVEYESLFIKREIDYKKITKLFILRHFYYGSQFTNTVKICVKGEFPIYLFTNKTPSTHEIEIIKLLESKTGLKSKQLEGLKAFLLH